MLSQGKDSPDESGRPGSCSQT